MCFACWVGGAIKDDERGTSDAVTYSSSTCLTGAHTGSASTTRKRQQDEKNNDPSVPFSVSRAPNIVVTVIAPQSPLSSQPQG
jgi:hypothetical protein